MLLHEPRPPGIFFAPFIRGGWGLHSIKAKQSAPSTSRRFVGLRKIYVWIFGSPLFLLNINYTSPIPVCMSVYLLKIKGNWTCLCLFTHDPGDDLWELLNKTTNRVVYFIKHQYNLRYMFSVILEYRISYN